MTRILVTALCLLALGACASIERLVIPKSELSQHSLIEVGTVTRVDHRIWDGFLSDHTVKDAQGVVRVRYGAVSAPQKAQLKSYLGSMARTDTRKLSKEAQLAYWVNLYNALTVDVILDHYPVASIRDIKTRTFDLGPWEDKRITINGTPTSLHDIEHGIIRPIWAEVPEVHYVLNCAATGCPNLGQRAYSAQNIMGALETAAVAYVNDPRGVRIAPNGSVTLSKIYSWYLDDFGGSTEAVLAHIRSYAQPQLKAALAETTRVRGYAYDWSLNDATGR